MLDNGDIRAWTPNVARRSLTPTEASMDPDDWWGATSGPQVQQVPGTFRGYVDEVMSRPDTPRTQPRFGGDSEGSRGESGPGPPLERRRHRDRRVGALTPDGGQVEIIAGQRVDREV